MKKFIYTLWTKPFIVKQNLYENIIYLLFSIELLKKQSSEIIIYTDLYGELILKHFLKDVEINTHILKNIDFHINRWAVPKLYTINSQIKPFCHIDHDVFLWEKTPIFESIDIVTQSYENENFNDNYFSKFYKELFINYITYNNNIDPIFTHNLINNDYAGYNCGFLDIYNTDVSKKWTDFAIELNNNYKNNFRFIDCTFVEQFSLYIIAKYFNFKIGELIPIIKYEKDGKINLKVGDDIKFTHLMGSKKDGKVLMNVTKSLEKLNPLLYNKIIDNCHLLFKK